MDFAAGQTPRERDAVVGRIMAGGGGPGVADRRRRRANLTPVTAPMLSCHDQRVLIRACGEL